MADFAGTPPYRDAMRESMPMQEPTRSLVARAKAGDGRAFDELVDRYRLRLSRRIEARMGAEVRSRIEVGDVLQETIACALQSIGKFRWQGEKSFYAWLGSIAEHVISNIARKKSWKHLQLKHDIAGGNVSPSRVLRRCERFDRLGKALDSLAPDLRESLVLARVKGLKITEIAERMHRSPNAVYKLLARALLQLKENFGDTESFHLPHQAYDIKEPDHDE